MLYRLEIENFFAFRGRQILDLTVPRNVRDQPRRFAPVFEGADLRAPKVIALFGANGSGKSTVVRALAFLVWFLRDSLDRDHAGIPCETFNDVVSANRPIRIAVEDGGRTAFDDRGGETYGTYRFELELTAEHGRVRSVAREALRQKPYGQGKWLRVFERRPSGAIAGSKGFSLSGYSRVIDKIRPDTSAVATLALFEHRPAQSLIAALAGVSTSLVFADADQSDAYVIKDLRRNPQILTQMSAVLRDLDLGIQEVRLAQAGGAPSLLFCHDGLYEDMPWRLQSQGTRSVIRVLSPVLSALSQGGLAAVDEMDQSLHPSLLREILRWFVDPERNPRDGQLLLTCQSASLMEHLTKDEIVLCDKDAKGRASAHCLRDVSSVRRGDNLYKKYLGGAFGAVPRFG